ncbi:NAD(P)H nitroreductase [Mycolicibacterium celeriflavum]|uniref:Acg family FMN-binding oxidoreductase n=1 Tax=Mycolicibacterium celeriflavum TaxID=1249101 RepID=UPI00080116F7|nr:nitroreductase family protein [Mycolicibacterium celeriflavum]OBG17523.1 NAD(P)H nitroreductase [Mycolicibacterium celeriflavum]
MTTYFGNAETSSAEFPDVDAIRTALSLATRAPSVHNSQPWLWKVGEESLHLYADRSRHLPSTDADQRDLIVSCGISLHHAVVGLAALGWRTKVHRFPNPADRNHLASLELTGSEPSASDVALAAAIPQRRTDRRHFSYWPISLADIATIGARLARMGVLMRRVEMTTDIRAIVAQAVWQHTHDDAYLAELAAWSGKHAATSGVPARNIPESGPTAQVPGRLFFGGTLKQPDEIRALDDHAVLLALGSAADDDLARLRAGEASSLMLLTATTLGLATCPVSEPLENDETRQAIREEVFDGRAYPQMMFRIGWAPVGADPLPSTPRRPLDEVVSTLDGSSPVFSDSGPA